MGTIRDTQIRRTHRQAPVVQSLALTVDSFLTELMPQCYLKRLPWIHYSCQCSVICFRLSHKFWATYPLTNSVLANASSVWLGLVLTLAVSSTNAHYPWGPSRAELGLLCCPHDDAAVWAVKVVGLSGKAARACGDRAPSSLELITQHNWLDWKRNTRD